MNWAELSKIISVILLCSVKFSLAGVPAAVVAGWPFLKAVTIIILGGVVGVLFFAYLSDSLLHWWHKWRKPEPKQKKKFTKTNKLVVRVKQRFGLIGISILTPLLLSIPIGVFIAIRFYHNRTKVVSYMIISVVFWSIALLVLYSKFYSYLLG